MSHPALTRAERELLQLVRLHSTVGVCYLAAAGRGRAALVVPEIAPTSEYTGRHVRWRAFNYRTAWHLVHRGLARVGTYEPIPNYDPRQVRHLESLDGRAITMTPEGEELLTSGAKR